MTYQMFVYNYLNERKMKYKESDDLNDLLSCAKTTPLTAEIYDTATSDIVATTDRTDAKKNNVKHIKQYY